MLSQIFLSSCLVMMTSCWRIDVSEKNAAIQLSLNVTLDCRNHDDNNNNNLGKFKEITKLKILKRNPHNNWISLAKVERDAQHVETSLQNVMLTGNASNLSNSFLKLQFPFATENAIGQFLCEVEGYYSGNKTHVVRTRTEPVVITQREATSKDILNVILQLKQQNRTKNVIDHLFVLLQTMIDFRDKDFEKMSNIHDKDIEKMSNLHEKDFKKMNDDIKSIVQAIPSPVWPTGRYSLLRAGTKCPYAQVFDWQFSSVRITTRPGRYNNDRTSQTSHLWRNTLEHNTATGRHYVNIRMCTTPESVKGPAWPKGSYCIQNYNGCPSGFALGNIEVGRHYDDGINKDVVSNCPVCDGDLKDYTDQYYCCRNDGNANTPIELPTRDPFYLYRKGGTCQKVKGMEESNEWIRLDTTNRDRKFGDFPDSDIKPLNLYLCYYKPIF